MNSSTLWIVQIIFMSHLYKLSLGHILSLRVMTKFVENFPDLIVWEIESDIPEQILEISKRDLILTRKPLKLIIEVNHVSGF